MKVLVTGADGFIGSHLVELLYQKGHEITALAHITLLEIWVGFHRSIAEEIKMISGDIRDLNFCQTIMEDIDIVFHLTAQLLYHFLILHLRVI